MSNQTNTAVVLTLAFFASGCATSGLASIGKTVGYPISVEQVRFDDDNVYVEWHCSGTREGPNARKIGQAYVWNTFRMTDLFGQTSKMDRRKRGFGRIPTDIISKSSPTLPSTSSVQELSPNLIIASTVSPEMHDCKPRPITISRYNPQSKGWDVAHPFMDTCRLPDPWWRKPIVYPLSLVTVALDIATSPLQIATIYPALFSYIELTDGYFCPF